MKLHGALEAILFAYGEEGVNKEELARTFNMEIEAFNSLLSAFQTSFAHASRGLECVDYGGVIKLITKSEYHDIITELMNYEKTRQLSQAALETLAIIAYKQPITRVEIEEIRGVNCDMMCRRLEALDLIKESGRSDSIGRPILYEVTDSFMDVFKLHSLKELPEIKLEGMEDDNDFFK